MNGLLAEHMISFSKQAFSTKFFLIRSLLRITCSITSGVTITAVDHANGLTVQRTKIALQHTQARQQVRFRQKIHGPATQAACVCLVVITAHLDGIEIPSGPFACQVDAAKSPSRYGLQDLKVLDGHIGVVALVSGCGAARSGRALSRHAAPQLAHLCTQQGSLIGANYGNNWKTGLAPSTLGVVAALYVKSATVLRGRAVFNQI